MMGQFVVPSQQKCQCSQISLQEQCKLLNCYWDGGCLEDSCENRSQEKCYGVCQWSDGKCINYNLSCADYSTQSSCDQLNNCAWSTQDKCQQFEKCSDYYVQEANQCYQKGNNQCEPTSTLINGKYQCRDKVNVDCGTLISKTICLNSQQSDNIQCGWKQSTNQCLPISNINSCEDVKDWQEMCDINACVWQNDTCKTRNCSSFTAQTTCKYIPNYAQTQLSVCSWTQSQCNSVQTYDELTEDQCFYNTNGGYIWKNDGCVACQGYAYSLNITIMLIILIFFG